MLCQLAEQGGPPNAVQPALSSKPHAQVQHRRAAGPGWRVQSGLFGASQAVSMDASTSLRPGDAITMDYGPDKLDSSLLLDYGVVDLNSPQVPTWPGCACTVCQRECFGWHVERAGIAQHQSIVEGHGALLDAVCHSWACPQAPFRQMLAETVMDLAMWTAESVKQIRKLYC